uniref:PIPK domain-containing protein n=1 Tax=Ditylenchus dipsaci TaxID=166011 RepID=A0A915CZG7_9BILA
MASKSSKSKTPRSLGKIRTGGKKIAYVGVNHTIGELMHVPPPGLLLPDDFKAFSKIKVDNHCFNRWRQHAEPFQNQRLLPNVFRNIREQFGVDQYEYLASLTSYEPEADPTESGVIDSEAVAEIHSILKQYHEYVVETHGKTLLPQYLGLYRITVDSSETYLLVMRNIFGGKYNIHKKYDLKGSTIQRQASEKEKSKELPTLKDNDFREDNYKLVLPVEAKKQILELLKKDTEFLTKLHLMDYSLLVGIHDLEQGAKEAEEQQAAGSTHHPYVSDPDSGEEIGPTLQRVHAESPRKLIYFIGLVDILTYYGVKKRTASAAKSVKYGSEAEEISTVKPEKYARRLLEFINQNVVCPPTSTTGATPATTTATPAKGTSGAPPSTTTPLSHRQTAV